MTRLVALLLVCVLAFSSVAALGEEDTLVSESVFFEPKGLVDAANALNYTSASDWVNGSYVRAAFSLLLYIDFVKAQDTSVVDFDMKKESFVFVDEEKTDIGLAYSNSNDQYKIILFFPDVNQAVYNLTSVDANGATMKAILESLGRTVYTNSLEDLTDVLNAMSGKE